MQLNKRNQKGENRLYYYFQVIWFHPVETQEKQWKTLRSNIIQKGGKTIYSYVKISEK